MKLVIFGFVAGIGFVGATYLLHKMAGKVSICPECGSFEYEIETFFRVVSGEEKYRKKCRNCGYIYS